MFRWGHSGRTAQKEEVYGNSQQFLSDNPVIREGVPFELEVENDPIPKGVYEFRGSDTLLNIRSHQSYPADIAVFNGKKKVKVRLATELEVTSIKRVSQSAARETLSYLTRGIETSAEAEKLGAGEKAELRNELNKSQYMKGKTLNDVLLEQAEKVTKKVVSVDFESYIDKQQKRISFENSYSAGITETTQTIYSLPGSPDGAFPGGFKHIASHKDKLTTFFDVNKVMDYLDKGTSEGNIYGKQNIALMYDSIRAYISGESIAPAWMDEKQKAFFEKSRQAAVATLGETAERIKNIPKFTVGLIPYTTASSNFIEMFERQFFIGESAQGIDTVRKEKVLDFLKFLQQNANKHSDWKLNNLQNQNAHMVYGEVNLGVVERQLDSERGGGSYYEETKITNNLRGAVTAAINKNDAKQISIYSAAETGAYNSDITALESQLRAAQARSASPQEIKEINDSLIKLKMARSKLVDMKGVTETLFDRLLPEIKRNLSDSSTGITRVIEKFVPVNIMRGLEQSTVGSFITDKGKGLSLENLYQILADPEAKEYHTGALDSRDLNHLRLMIEDIFTSSKHYKSNTTHSLGQNLKGIMESPYGLFDLSATVARRIQQKVVTSYVAEQSSIDDLFSIAKKGQFSESDITSLTDLYNNYKSKSEREEIAFVDRSFRKTFKESMERTLIKRMDADFNSVSEEYATQRARLSKFSTETPGLLAKAVTTPAVSRVAALAGFLWLTRNNAEDDPGASIETGEHNAMETVARRVMTTPFNSAISLGVVGKFAKSILNRIGNKLPSISNKFNLSDSAIQAMEKRALMPTVVSSERRAIKELVDIDKYASVLTSTSSRVERLVVDRTIRNRTSSPLLNKTLEESVKMERLAKWNNIKLSNIGGQVAKSKVRYQTANGFFIGSSGPSTKVETLGLTFPRPGREVFIDQSNVFGFMKQNTNLAAADQAYIATRNPKIYSFDTPSFSPYWTGRTHISKKTYKSATIMKDQILLPYNQEVKFSSTPLAKDQEYVSTVMAKRKSFAKYDKFINFNNSNFDLKNYYDYEGTLMKSAGHGVETTLGSNSLYASISNRQRTPNTTIIGRPESLLDNKPVLVSSPNKPQVFAPGYSKDKGIDSVLKPVVRQPKRLDPNDYINDANMMLSGKGGFQTAGNYPASTSQVMGYINQMASRY